MKRGRANDNDADGEAEPAQKKLTTGKWSTEDTKELIRLVNLDTDVAEIMTLLNRGEASISSKVSALNKDGTLKKKLTIKPDQIKIGKGITLLFPD